METLLVCLLAGYGVWLAAYLLWERRQSKHAASPADVGPPKHEDDVPDIVGKSSFRMKPTTPKPIIPTPQTIMPSETESAEEKASTFAPDADNRRPAQLTEAELDAAFEHLEIPDVPLEYEDDEAAGADEEMLLAVHPAGYASGVSFEQIDRAVRTASDASATDAERREAGRIFGQIEGTELYDRLVDLNGRGRGDGSSPTPKQNGCTGRCGQIRHSGFCVTIKNGQTMKEKEYG